MSLQDDAKEIIDRVSAELNPLFLKYGFETFTRRSDPIIFNEILGYQKDPFEIRISACLHPHDYPNPLSVSLIKKIPGDWRYVHLPDLFKSVDEANSFSYDDLMVHPQNNFDVTLSKLHQYCELVLKDLTSSESKIKFR